MKMSKNTPLVSVVMPAYNSEKYISEAIESILNQTFKDFEFIIINDASTDGTMNIIKKYAELDDRIIVLNNEKNMNIAESRNSGVRIASGRYVVTMDSDDIASLDRLYNQYEFLESNKDIAISIGNINVMNGSGVSQYTRMYPLTDRDIRSKVYRFNPFPNPTIMCRREVYMKTGNYDNFYVPIDDFDFWLRAGTFFKFGNCNKIVLDYRVASGSASHMRIRLTEKITFKLRWKALRLGYSFTFGDLLFNIVHLVTFLMLPSMVKVKIFNLLRRYKVVQ